MRIIFKKFEGYYFDVFVEDINEDFKVATVELFFTDNKYWLNKIQLEGNCYRKNYGVFIIKQLNKEFSPFRISLSSKNAHYSNKVNSSDSRCLTLDGFYLVKKCFQKGILNRSNFEFPYSEKNIYYQADSFLNKSFSVKLNFINSVLIFIDKTLLLKSK